MPDAINLLKFQPNANANYTNRIISIQNIRPRSDRQVLNEQLVGPQKLFSAVVVVLIVGVYRKASNVASLLVGGSKFVIQASS